MTNTLNDLVLGERARVVGFSSDCPLAEQKRLFDLGLLPGTPVVAELCSPSGDPTAYRIRGALMALRASQAVMILVQTEDEE